MTAPMPSDVSVSPPPAPAPSYWSAVWHRLRKSETRLEIPYGVAIAAATVLYGLVMAVPLLVKPWGPKRVRLAPITGVTGASDGPPPVPTVDDRHLEPQPR